MRKFLSGFILIFTFLLLSSEVTFALDMSSSTVCGKDINSDGFFAQDELKECISGVCPYDTVNCDAELQDPVCLAGGTLNTERDMCQADSVNSCPTGYTYDQSLDRCTRTVECSDGGLFSPITDRCEKLAADSCPDTYTLDAENNLCWKAVDCGTGGTFNAAKDRCEMALAPSCAAGFTYNAATGKCEANPTCTAGTYSATYNKCLKPLASKTCPSGYSYVAARDRCEMTPVCASGTYNAVTNKCESTTTSSYAASITGNGLSQTTNSGGQWCLQLSGTLIRFGYFYNGAYSWGAWVDMNGAGSSVYTALFAAKYGITISSGQISTFNPDGGAGSYSYPIPLIGSGLTTPSPLGTARLMIRAETTPGYIRVWFYSNGYYPTASGAWVPIGYSCPSGGTLSGSTCTVSTLVQTSPTCPSGTMDYTTDTCYAAYTPTCDPGLTYDAASGQCAVAATCPASSVLDGATDKCTLSPGASCTTGWTFDAVNNICYSAPTCLNGIFNAATNLCNASIVPDCGAYTFNTTDQKCTQDVACPNLQPGFSTAGTIAFSPELDICVSSTQHDCPTNYAYNGLPVAKCEAVIVCPSGTYNPTLDQCQLGEYTCPLGNYTCSDINGDGNPECSAFSCVNLATSPAAETPTDTTAYQNDGTVDPATGECSGVFKIFNGNGKECLPAGWNTSFFNCCDDSQGSFLLFKEYCTEENATAVQAVAAGRAHYIGDYCKKKITLIGCIQKAKMYCVFNSKFGRIIQEQGRPQLKKFAPDGNWGTPEAPNCEGFTPEEFQMLDFSKIDLSELFGDLNPISQINVESKIENAVGGYIDKIQ